MTPLDTKTLEHLATRISGPVLRPGDDGFAEAASVWNARFVRTPAGIARCTSSEDVADAIRFAREHTAEVSVKGGGHDYAGNTVGEGSLLIDLSPLDQVRVDAEARRVTVGAGCRWAQVDAATLPHGLATPSGTVSTVGVGGFTLGGGLGWLSRKYGMAADNLISATVVTAEGDVVRASEQENPDLFWALRGGGGNFGVVTSFEYRLHPVEREILAGQVLYPVERAGELLRFYRDYFRDAPDEVMCFPFLIRIPPMEIFPEEAHGEVVLDFVVAYLGPADEAEPHLAPFREQGGAYADFVAVQPYQSLQQAFDAGMGPGNRWYSRSTHFDVLTDEAIDALVGGLDPFPGAFTAVYLGPQGGAVSRVPGDAMAYPHRSSAHELHIFPGWASASDDPTVMGWADALFDAVRPFGNGRVYVNLLGDGEADRVPDAYRGNFDRLQKLKRAWDPDNIFHRNHNIRPAE